MKRVWIAAGLLVFVGILCAMGLVSVSNRTVDLNTKMEQTEALVRDGNMEEALTLAREIEAHWRQSHKILATFIEHNRLETIDQSISVLPVWLEQNKKDEFFAECRRAREYVLHLKETETPIVENIL